MGKHFKKSIFYLFAVIIIFSGQFLLNNGLLIGRPPVIDKKMLNGHYMNDSIDTNKPSLIYFWAKWCGVCKMMQEPLNEVLKDYSGKTIIVKSGDEEEVRQFLNEKKLDWDVLNDPFGVIAEKYRVKGVPAVFFLDKQGIIKLTATGYVSEIGLRLRLWLVQFF